MGRKLYVGNLPFRVDDAGLADLFARVGTVESASVARDVATGRARGFGFVEMSTDEEAQRAIETLNGTDVEGRTIAVNEARPKPDRGGGGGDRGMGGGRGPGWGRRGAGGGGRDSRGGRGGNRG
jgi:RNA recognition motif-containing protein